MKMVKSLLLGISSEGWNIEGAGFGISNKENGG